MYQIKLTHEEKDELIILHRSCRKDLRKGDRIKTILLLDEGYSAQEVAQTLLLDEDTITTYKKLIVKKFIRENIITNSETVILERVLFSEKVGTLYAYRINILSKNPNCFLEAV